MWCLKRLLQQLAQQLTQQRLAATLALFLALAAAAAGAEGDAKRGRTVLVVGDSISAAYGMQEEQGWVNLLRQRLAERLGGDARVVNASISGDTTGGGLARLPRTLAEHQPDVVVIELGGNDGLRGYPIDSIRANLLAMTQAVIAAGGTPLLAGMQIPPNYGPRYTRAFHGMYHEIATTTGAALVPFLLEGVAKDRELMQRDGIHPTASAQARLLDNVWPVLVGLIE